MLSYLLPSMQRCESLKRAVQSLLDTSPINETEYCVVIDMDERSNDEIVELLDKNNASFKVDFSTEKRGALNAWNIALKLSSGDLLFPIGDDQLAHGGWYDKVIFAHNGLDGYGMVGVNDLMHDGSVTVATTTVFDRKFCREILGGVVAYPHYKYYCVDSELCQRAKNANKFVWLSDAVVEHLHSANGKRPLDAHDKERVENDYQTIDMKEFERRKSLNFPNDFEPVI